MPRFIKPALVALALGFLPGVAQAAGFACGPRVVADEPASAGDIKAILPTGDALADPTQLNTAIQALSKRGLSKLLIVDNIIAAHCASVAANGELSDAEKRARMLRFSRLATQSVYANDDADKIILDIALPPDVVTAIQVRAKAAGVTAQEWVATTAAAAVAKN
jgi:hypothetical protein